MSLLEKLISTHRSYFTTNGLKSMFTQITTCHVFKLDLTFPQMADKTVLSGTIKPCQGCIPQKNQCVCKSEQIVNKAK